MFQKLRHMFQNIIMTPVGRRAYAKNLFETPIEVAGVVEAGHLGDLLYGAFRVYEQQLCGAFQPSPAHVGGRGQACRFFNFSVQIGAAHAHFATQVFDIELRASKVLLNGLLKSVQEIFNSDWSHIGGFCANKEFRCVSRATTYGLCFCS
jgi:hypothetical protein